MAKSWLLTDPRGLTCQIIHGNSLEALHAFNNQFDLIMTSPPYADARKKHYDSIKPNDYAEWFCRFHEAFWTALKFNGSLAINIKDKVIQGVRHRYVWQTIESLSTLGWCCIDDYIWHKKTSMPGYWPTRLRDSWEYIFHLAKNTKPFMDQNAVKIPISPITQRRVKNIKDGSNSHAASTTGSGFSRNLSAWKNKTSVLPTNVLYLSTESHNRNHPAVYPVSLPTFFIKLLSNPGDKILDPFGGSGSTAIAAIQLGRHCVLIDNQYEYCLVAKGRLIKECGMKETRKSKVIIANNFAVNGITI